MTKEHAVAMSELLARMTIDERLEAAAREMDNLAQAIGTNFWNRPPSREEDILDDIVAMEYERAIAKATGNYDPTPWCTGCGSMTRAGCDCGPIADNN